MKTMQTNKLAMQVFSLKNLLILVGVQVENFTEQKDKEKKTFDSKGVQVKSCDLIFSFHFFIKTDGHLLILCGLRNFNFFNTLAELVDRFYPRKRSCDFGYSKSNNINIIEIET